jgi:hypothetical protein
VTGLRQTYGETDGFSDANLGLGGVKVSEGNIMRKSGLAALIALVAGAAQAAPIASCGEMVSHLDAYLMAHPNATGDLRQTVDAQLMHQPTRESVEKAKMESRDHLVELLASAKAHQAAGEERKCRSTLAEVKWMLQR